MQRSGMPDCASTVADSECVCTIPPQRKARYSSRWVAVSDEGALAADDALAQVRAQPAMEGQALVAEVSTSEPYVFAAEGAPHVAVVDYGAKRSIMRLRSSA